MVPKKVLKGKTELTVHYVLIWRRLPMNRFCLYSWHNYLLAVIRVLIAQPGKQIKVLYVLTSPLVTLPIKISFF